MKKTLLIIASAIFLSFNLAAQEFVKVDKTAERQVVQLNQNQVLEISLPAIPSAGYGWYAFSEERNEFIPTKSISNGVVAQIGNKEYVSLSREEDMVGGEENQIMRFVGVSEGTCEIKLYYARPWEKGIEPLDEFTITVNSEGVYTGTYKPIVKKSNLVPIQGNPSDRDRAYPVKFFWGDQYGTTPVKNQANCGSCWAFAGVGCIEAAIKIKDYKTTDVSEQWIMNCIGSTGGTFNGCQGGSNDPFQFVSGQTGVVYEATIPYACANNGTESTCIKSCNSSATKQEKMTGYLDLSTTYAAIKQAIYDYGAVYVSMDADGDSLAYYKKGVFTYNDPAGTNGRNHAVVLVGWNDDPNDGLDDHWYMRNSWGANWGENGYIRIKYGLQLLGGSPSIIKYGSALISHTLAPVANFSALNLSSCNGGPFQFIDSSYNVPTSWAWNFGDGTTSTLQNPTHTYTASGTYTVTLTATNAYGNNVKTRTSYITVTKPAAPTATGTTISAGNTATLTASGTGTLKWYDAATNGNLLATGTSFTTPPLTQTTSYYVQNDVVSTEQTIGSTAPTINGGYYAAAATQGIVFNASAGLTIKSVDVKSSEAGDRTIYLKNRLGEVIASKVVNIPVGSVTVPLDIYVPAGEEFVLYPSNACKLWRDTLNGNYPYTVANLATITNNTIGNTALYYFFYNIKIQKETCSSSRTQVTVVISGMEDFAKNNVKLFPVPSITGQVRMEFDNISNEINLLSVQNTIGEVVYTEKIESGNFAKTFDFSHLTKGIYIIRLTGNEKTILGKMILQ